MRLHPLFVFAPLVFAPFAGEAGAQERERSVVVAPRAGTRVFLGDESPRAVLGITTSPAAGVRDTLGLLVSMVHPGGPADRAGIEEGNRLVAINGVNLRVSPADADDHESASLVGRRLTRELSKLKPGDAVELRVYNGGQTRSVRVPTASSDSLYRRRRSEDLMAEMDERAAIGIGLGATGSVRDTLGVLVMSVVDTGPAARAGLEEGNRIAAINGVDLRVPREDRGDGMVAEIKARRLQRELAKVKPGDEVELRVYSAGQFRNVRVRAVKASSLHGNRRTMFIQDGAPGMMPFLRAPEAIRMREMMPSRPPILRMQHARPGAPGRAGAVLHTMSL